MSSSDGTINGRFALFCDYALMSSDNKLSVIGEFDQINSTNDTPVLHKGFLVASFDGDSNSKANIDVKLADPKEENILFKGTFNINFSHTGRANILIEFGSLPFKKFGIYEAIFTNSGKPIIKTQIKVIRVKEKVAAQA